MEPLEVYACYNRKQKLRLNSSSGGIFSALADYVLSCQGIVYGVVMSEDCYQAKFIGVTDKKELDRLRGSKYLQAKMGDTYRQVESNLLEGMLVLFTGTGCQINGLKKFLRKDYNNLICVDVVCHGVPSPKLWKKYVYHQESLYDGKLSNVEFRCKDISWTDFGMKEIFLNESTKSRETIFISKKDDSYMQMFLRDYCLRPSCYNCMAKKMKLSDISIADFWGINDVIPEMNDEKGTSLVLVRTKKGNQLIEQIREDLKVEKVTYKESVKGNVAEFKSCMRPIIRDPFFEDMNSMSYEELAKKYAAPKKVPLKIRIKRKIIAKIKSLNIIKSNGLII